MIFDFFTHNWVSESALETHWPNRIQTAPFTGQESRNGLSRRPQRMLTSLWTGMSRGESERLHRALLRAGQEQITVPLYMDQAITNLASSGTTINCPTSHRRFFVGFKGVIYSPASGRWEEFVVSAKSSTTLTLSGALSTTYPARSLVFPAIDVEVVLNSQLTFVNSRIGQGQVTLLEVTDARRLPSLLDWTTLPAGVVNVEVPGVPTLPLFPGLVNWDEVQINLQRAGTTSTVGRGTQTQLDGERPLHLVGFEVLALGRAEAWQMVEFFDYVRGGLLPFWLVMPCELVEAVVFDDDWVEVVANGNEADVEEFVRAIAITAADGSVQIARVQDVDDLGDTFRINFQDPIDSTDAARADVALLVRNDSDAQEEVWITDEHCRFQVGLKELADFNEDVESPVEEL